ncbi:DNA polymerase III subunit delta' [Candidatus Venteria ishoeyi]|uniref:DNA polymerase III subunit delta' n=1 Tax=Candidatus Venteria ishoeyi TaxID=1899563 RepID=A0A1H6FBP8_9GAMM|nr:DNA polymerase III subunit delta' [Candidatus Venteria ishoeyi]SEH06739.1 DNA polymerase III subunit delta' [Candidatus Venteria ishoeyi]
MDTEAPIFPWHDKLWLQLLNSFQQHRLSHATLLAGTQGMGKLHFAQRLAHLVLCKNPDVHGKACGVCKSCLLLAAQTHPDLHIVQPETGKKIIRIDDIRALLPKVALTPKYHRSHVVIVYLAEQMNDNAANSLLKLLEEPPPHTLLILISHQTAQLLPTLRSRCQHMDFSQPPVAVCQAWLQTQLQAQNKQLDMPVNCLLTLSANAPLSALLLLDKLPQRDAVFLALMALKQEKQDPINTAIHWLETAPDDSILWLTDWLMDMIRWRSGGFTASSQAQWHNQDKVDALQELADSYALSDLFQLLDLHLQNYQQLKYSNVRPQGLMQELALAWVGIMPA